MTLSLLILAAFLAGVIGAFWCWIRGLADEADEYDGIKHSAPSLPSPGG